MKKIIVLIILFLLSTMGLSAQYIRKPNTLYATFRPVEFGYGVRYDREIKETHGIYISLIQGSYQLKTGEYIKHHYMLSTGIFINIFDKLLAKEVYRTHISVGLNYHRYDGIYNPFDMIPAKAFNPFSCDIGVGAKILSKYNIAIRVDPIKWESSIDFGYSF